LTAAILGGDLLQRRNLNDRAIRFASLSEQSRSSLDRMSNTLVTVHRRTATLGSLATLITEPDRRKFGAKIFSVCSGHRSPGGRDLGSHRCRSEGCQRSPFPASSASSMAACTRTAEIVPRPVDGSVSCAPAFVHRAALNSHILGALRHLLRLLSTFEVARASCHPHDIQRSLFMA